MKVIPILNKSWNSPTPSSKKFLSRLLSHHLSREIDRQKFEVVYEGSLDVFSLDSQEPDIVVYSKGKNFFPVLAIEICKKDDVMEMALTARMLVDRFGLKEFFLFDFETPCWYRLKNNDPQVEISQRSELLNTGLDDIVYLNPR